MIKIFIVVAYETVPIALTLDIFTQVDTSYLAW